MAAASIAVRAKSAKIAKAREEQQHQEWCPHVLTVKTHIWIAKQGVPLDRQSVYEILQLLSMALFARVPLHQFFTPPLR
ncbi:hypothetical protein [Gemmatimonas sp.]|uniref:hypothetical protein n=1 Tax=Gemmatimonas sp. TaxID=1962908 RepID=UPI003567841D